MPQERLSVNLSLNVPNFCASFSVSMKISTSDSLQITYSNLLYSVMVNITHKDFEKKQKDFHKS